MTHCGCGSTSRDGQCGQTAGRALTAGLVRDALAVRVLPENPAVDVYRDEAAFHVIAEVPGFTRDEIELEIAGDTLRILGRRSGPADVEAGTLVRERMQGGFARCVELPGGVDADSATAVLDRGLLEIVLPLAYKGRVVRIRPE